MSKCCPKCGKDKHVVVHGHKQEKGNPSDSRDSQYTKAGAIAGMAAGSIVPGLGNFVGGLIGALGGTIVAHLTEPTHTVAVYRCTKCDHKFS